ncbi:hypothetical protein [Okeania sp. KiyG1]|uniref:hypothetical protein n=1 Tax=Okeania sp. KiyG1 TaxID=2720165 RepID=UPI0019BA02B8|nr:hypothetical protein [Okeania sp. KiyG1]GFZ90937.1 hypothetical protein CYANOKiyG1_01250 [Okeania sp. KiyG1]
MLLACIVKKIVIPNPTVKVNAAVTTPNNNLWSLAVFCSCLNLASTSFIRSASKAIWFSLRSNSTEAAKN